MVRFRIVGVFAVLLLAVMGEFPALAQTGYWAGVAEEVCAEITQAEAFAKAGKMEEAKGAVIKAYFEIFEEKKMEIAERANLGRAHTADVEELFNSLRKAVGKSGAADVPKLAEALRKTLRADGKALDTAKVKPDGFEGVK